MERVSISETASDRDLVELLQAGDEEAFDVLVTRHQQRAFNVAFQVLRNHEDAAEVAQDAFVKVYRSVNEFRGESEFTTWLHAIVTNLARNKRRWWKRRGLHVTVSLEGPVQPGHGPMSVQTAAPTKTADAEVADAECVNTLSAKMAQLSPRFREVLVLRNVEDMSYDQIATALGCSVGTVKSRIARAREALRDAMAGEW